jgi:hypothetical protein
MKSLFEASVVEDLERRIMRLSPDSERLWGKMPVALMLAHCTSGLQMAMGTIKPKRAPFPGNVIGRLIKPLVFGDDKPMRRNSASIPELFPTEATGGEFERERTQLIQAIDRFVSAGEACCSEYPHPFFGPLKPEEWAILMYKHVDHHMRQFGV